LARDFLPNRESNAALPDGKTLVEGRMDVFAGHGAAGPDIKIDNQVGSRVLVRTDSYDRSVGCHRVLVDLASLKHCEISPSRRIAELGKILQTGFIMDTPKRLMCCGLIGALLSGRTEL
jgi:hypothetical protein